ncbi:hypothetical protein BJV74DRAFT_406566 [Russula compacta]|nr:hypothetical protein BJV74DRAFT_406566 [Russula compacta]
MISTPVTLRHPAFPSHTHLLSDDPASILGDKQTAQRGITEYLLYLLSRTRSIESNQTLREVPPKFASISRVLPSPGDRGKVEPCSTIMAGHLVCAIKVVSTCGRVADRRRCSFLLCGASVRDQWANGLVSVAVTAGQGLHHHQSRVPKRHTPLYGV